MISASPLKLESIEPCDITINPDTCDLHSSFFFVNLNRMRSCRQLAKIVQRVSKSSPLLQTSQPARTPLWSSCSVCNNQQICWPPTSSSLRLQSQRLPLLARACGWLHTCCSPKRKHSRSVRPGQVLRGDGGPIFQLAAPVRSLSGTQIALDWFCSTTVRKESCDYNAGFSQTLTTFKVSSLLFSHRLQFVSPSPLAVLNKRFFIFRLFSCCRKSFWGGQLCRGRSNSKRRTHLFVAA